jgi:hypothetical protein
MNPMKTDKKEILRELLLSENRGYVVSIKIKDQKRPLKTGVKRVEHNKIILHPTCIFGHPLDRSVITLVEIEWVKLYKVFYSSPVYESIRIIKDNMRLMKNNLSAIGADQSIF